MRRFLPINCRTRVPRLNRLIPWERFRQILESIPKAKAKRPGGRKPYDRILLFKMMVLQQRHNLSDEQAEYPVRDRLSFRRFLGIGLEEAPSKKKRTGVNPRIGRILRDDLLLVQQI